MSSNNELLDKIKEDLNKSGFISELKAGRVAKRLEWRVSFNPNYHDLDTGKSREFDLRIAKYIEGKDNFNFHIELDVEVKKSKKPWIVFIEDVDYSIAKLEVPGFRVIHADENFSTKVLDSSKLMDGFMRLEKDYIGRNFCEAFKDPSEPSKIYESLISISKASIHCMKINSSATSTNSYNPQEPTYFHVFQPLVILEGNLIGAKLDANGEISLSALNYIPLSIEYCSAQYDRKIFFPDIITLEYLEKYLSDFESWGKKILGRAEK